MEIDGVARCPRCLSPMAGEPCAACGPAPFDAPPGCLEPETILNGRYLIGAAIGAGGFGVTYAAWDMTLDQPVAVKEYFPRRIATRDIAQSDQVGVDPAQDSAALFELGRKRFLREARMLAALDGTPGVVGVWDLFEANRTAYLVMEFVRGVSLERHVQTQGALDPDAALAMMRGPIEALAAVHRAGLLHRDVSPANLMLEPGGQLKLIDFGAATDLPQDGAAHDATVILRRGYAAPEQYQRGGSLGAWTDVYGACATLCFLITGKKPDEGGPQPPYGLPLSRKKRRALARGLEPNWKSRTQGMPELLWALYGVPLPEELARQRRRLRRAAWCAGGAVAISLLLLANAFLGIPAGSGLRLSLGRGGFYVLGYGGADPSPQIPTHFLGVPLRGIGQAAFRDQAQLQALIVPEGIVSIGDWAFYGCENLLQVALPDSVTRIQASAFDQCGKDLVLYGSADSSAARFALEAGLPFTDPAQFEYRQAQGGLVLTQYTGTAQALVIPGQIDGQDVVGVDFDGQYSLDVMKVALPATVRTLGDACFMWFELLDAVDLPLGLQVIGDEAFCHTALGDVVVPQGVVAIGANAFSNCYQLERAQLPPSLARLGPEAFAYCAMEEMALPHALAAIEASAFTGCARLARVRLPQALEIIEEGAFANCAALEEVIVPEGVRAIGADAFRGCGALKSVVIPPTVQAIGDFAFYACADDLVIFGATGSAAQAYAAKYGVPFDAMDLWAPQADFDWYAMWDGVYLDNYNGDAPHLVMPSYVDGQKVAGILAQSDKISFFADGYQPISVVLPRYGKDLPHSFFLGLTALQQVTLPQGLELIDMGAFEGCAALKSLDLPGSLRIIGMDAFSGCAALTKLRLPGGELDLDARWLAGSSIQELAFAQGIKYIGDWFEAGDALSRVHVPPSAVHIEDGAFRKQMGKENFALVGQAGSYVETYAKAQGIRFEIE